MFEMKLYYGTVVDNDDPDELGKVKIQLLQIQRPFKSKIFLIHIKLLKILLLGQFI
jgi:hypothetical protein